jgi:hypothetical protein
MWGTTNFRTITTIHAVGLDMICCKGVAFINTPHHVDMVITNHAKPITIHFAKVANARNNVLSIRRGIVTLTGFEFTVLLLFVQEERRRKIK